MDFLSDTKGLLCSYSYSARTTQEYITLASEVAELCIKHRRLLRKILRREEAIAETESRLFQHILNHYDSSKGSLDIYFKSLAQTILKDSVSKHESPVSVYDGVLRNDEGELNDADVIDVLTVKNDTLNTQPVGFEEGLIQDVDKAFALDKLQKTMLGYLSEFLEFGRKLTTHDLHKFTFSKEFKKACEEYSLEYSAESLVEDATAIYNANYDILDWFNNLTCSSTTWQPAEFRIAFVNRQVQLKDKGYIGELNRNEYLVRVDYSEAVETLYEKYIETETNEVKCYLGNNYILRTLAGDTSYSINPDVNNAFAVQHQEVLTNVFKTVYRGIKVLKFDADYVWGITTDNSLKDVTVDIYGIKLAFMIEYLEVLEDDIV